MSTVRPGGDNVFFDEFLDDFFAECDEHLTLIRHSLLALERFVEQPQVDRPLLDDLFRAFHSLKGLAGMVGVSQVEQLAHHMESYLRALRQQQVVLHTEALDALVAGTRLLEQSVAAYRTKADPFDVAPILARLEALTLEAEPAVPLTSAVPVHIPALSSDDRARLADAQTRNVRVWRVTFLPTPQLSERGINVNSVRSRLQARGELIRAVPQVLPTGGVAFEFLVADTTGDTDLAGWHEDGLTAAPYDATPLTPAEPAPTARVDVAPTHAAASIVRVDLERLDDLMRMVGDLLISRARLEDTLARVEDSLPVGEARGLREINQAFERQLRELRTSVLRTRMTPIGDVFVRMQFVVRDLAHDLHKQVALELSGQHTEIDKFVVERLMDPLLHLVRNAISHGLELPDERATHGKPPTGTIALQASTAGDMVTISIKDDGHGIDVERVAARARALHLLGDNESLDESHLLDVLCAPGFSTREHVDHVSGRGVGMDVVATTVRELGGTLTLATALGRGTTFTLQLPLTLAIMDALIVAVADQRFAVPLAMVREVIAVQPALVATLERNDLLAHRGGALPLVRLAQRFGIVVAPGRNPQALVVGAGLAAVGIVVDRILGKREIVVRPLSDPLLHIAGIAGATELGDGRVVLIVDVAALVRQQ